MTIQMHPLTDLIGAEITGIDLAAPLDEATRQELYRLFAEKSVLVFHDQRFDPPQFAAAAELFGEIIPEQFPNYRLPEYPKVSFLSNHDLEQTGKQRAVRGKGFHTDHSNYAAPPKATILHGIIIPASGGDTGSPASGRSTPTAGRKTTTRRPSSPPRPLRRRREPPIRSPGSTRTTAGSAFTSARTG
jgi:alpha-ketoglutarate-dependent taurine dioxygenase